MEMIRPTDSDLLARFATHRDEDAFSELMRRHGSMVHSVSSRILSSADADDATQAVFLTLTHKAADLRREESLAAWLHRVAVRVSLDLRKSAAARQRREQHVAALRETFPVQSAEDRELFAQLDAELDQLPEKYRAPLVLHHLQGLTQDETAQRLKRKAGTISMQLNRARDMLRQRLERRNAATVGTAMALLLAAKLQAAEVPVALAKTTLTNASLVAAGNTAATGSVAALTQGALSMLFIEKVKAVAMIALSATVFLGASGTLAYKSFAEETPQKPAIVSNIEVRTENGKTVIKQNGQEVKVDPQSTTTTSESSTRSTSSTVVNGKEQSSHSVSATSKSVNGKTHVEVKLGDKVVAQRDYNHNVSVESVSDSNAGATKQKVTIKDESGKVIEVLNFN